MNDGGAVTPGAPTATIVCPHCGNPAAVAGAAFCGSCGMALPAATPVGPRVVTGRGTARTAAGQKLQADELLRTARRAARSLLSIGIVNLMFGAINLQFVLGVGRFRQTQYIQALTASMLIAGAFYVALFFWAKLSPLAATVTGLAVYVAKWIADVVIRATLYHVNSAVSSNTNSYQFVRLIMVFYLAGGVLAAIKHRRLMREVQAASAPMPVLPA